MEHRAPTALRGRQQSLPFGHHHARSVAPRKGYQCHPPGAGAYLRIAELSALSARLVFRPSSIDGQRSPEFLEFPGLPVSRTCQSKIVGTLVARGLTLCSLHDKAILFAEFMRLV